MCKLNNLIRIREYGIIKFPKGVIGDIVHVDFKNTYNTIPQVLSGVDRYDTHTNIAYGSIKISNVTRFGFDAILVYINSSDYSPTFPYILYL